MKQVTTTRTRLPRLRQIRGRPGFDGQRLAEEEREKLRLAGKRNLFLGARAGTGARLGEGAKAAR